MWTKVMTFLSSITGGSSPDSASGGLVLRGVGVGILILVAFFPLTAAAFGTSSKQLGDKAQSMLKGKSVLLTGATGGLGKAFARQLASCGTKKLVLSGRSMPSLTTMGEELSGEFPSVEIVLSACDLSDKASVDKLGTEAASQGVDVLINNGGVSSRSNFLETKFQVDERIMQINYLSGVSLAKKVVPGMVEKKDGKIIWVSSVQGLVGIPSRTSYAASKFAVQGFCEALHAELASSGIGVHIVSPGYIKTNLSVSALTGDGTTHGKMDETTAKGADPTDVATEILNSVADGKENFVVAATTSAKAAIYLRFLAPSFLRTMLVKRFDKSQKKDS